MAVLHRTTAALSAVALVLLLIDSQARGCETCNRLGSNSLELPHPRAIEVAVATRAAIDKGILKASPEISRSLTPDGGDGLTPLHKVPAPRLVEDWKLRLAESKPNLRSLAVHFIFIDTEQSCGLLVREGAVIFEDRPTFYTDAKVVTTRAAFHAILDGTVRLADAQRSGMLLIDGDPRAALLLPGR